MAFRVGESWFCFVTFEGFTIGRAVVLATLHAKLNWVVEGFTIGRAVVLVLPTPS